jgi:hypothetical protein
VGTSVFAVLLKGVDGFGYVLYSAYKPGFPISNPDRHVPTTRCGAIPFKPKNHYFTHFEAIRNPRTVQVDALDFLLLSKAETRSKLGTKRPYL